jgi:cbb3-type cytochrome oxidase cytochrome c subunit
MVWIFMDDNDDDFKVYQKTFRKMEIETAKAKLEDAISEVKDEQVHYLQKLEKAQSNYESQLDKIELTQEKITNLNAKFYKTNMDYLHKKAEIDALKYLVEKEKSHIHEFPREKDSKYESQYQTYLQELHALKIEKETIEALQNKANKELDNFNQEVEKAEGELNDIMRDVNLVETKLSRLDRQKMTFSNRIGDMIRDFPIIDFLDPYYKVKQIVVPDVKYDVNFASVSTVDRCTSCHLGIDNPDYVDAEQPYRTHPNLDLYLTAPSPHPIDQFGCTGCHAGRSRGTTFNSAVHMPNSKSVKQDWEDKFDWEKMHHWLKPMMPLRYSESGCFKCHMDKPDLKGGEKLNLGLSIIDKAGCNGCHQIESYPKRFNTGPDLTRLGEKVSKDWTKKWISHPQSFRYNTWMPHFFDQENNASPEMVRRNNTEINAMVEFLFKDQKNKNESSDKKYLGDAENGKILFDNVGCRGCHNLEEESTELADLGYDLDKLPYEYSNSEFGYEPEKTDIKAITKQQGPNLIGMGSKSSPEWVYNWIKNPKEYWPDTRMPDLRLSDQEAKDITSYLISFKNEEFGYEKFPELDQVELEKIAKGWLVKSYSEEKANRLLSEMEYSETIDYVADKSIRFYGCFSCHNISGYENEKPIGTALTSEGSKTVDKLDFGHIHDIEHLNYAWFEQKLASPRIFDRHKIVMAEEKLRMPNFYLKPEEIEAVVTALLSFNEDKVSESKQASFYQEDHTVYEGYKLLNQYNCRGCHIIDGSGGQIVDIIGAPEFSPPNLNTEGEKVNPSWLFKFLKEPTLIRPNLQVRMPTFTMTDSEWNSVIAAFQDMDENHLVFESDYHVNTQSNKFKAGEKLQELGECSNCHFYGTIFPKQGAETWAPNLALSKDRLRPDWIVKWLNDPQSVMPGTKMPAPYIPSKEEIEMDDSKSVWGKELVSLKGDRQKMLEGLRDFNLSISGKKDISKEIKSYFDKNGYNFGGEEAEDEDDWDDDDW